MNDFYWLNLLFDKVICHISDWWCMINAPRTIGFLAPLPVLPSFLMSFPYHHQRWSINVNESIRPQVAFILTEMAATGIITIHSHALRSRQRSRQPSLIPCWRLTRDHANCPLFHALGLRRTSSSTDFRSFAFPRSLGPDVLYTRSID